MIADHEVRLASRTPLHLWIVGVLSLLWNSIGCVDYTMSRLHNAAYLANMPAEQLAYFDSFPAWAIALWAFGVWGALAGSVLLLLRKRWAVTAFAISLAGLVLMTVYQLGLSNAPAMMHTASNYGFTALLWLIAIALLLYARRQAANGVLR
ncbi:hypothetical protein HMF7854_03410 [Sphingomonas ginkgonis]|uniref:Sugar transporter n=2 Tax=Sphingomonas ginkgonis TaxID=2315330 RepID=A0A3R9WQT8_9SPHN|nr:hypothetical protein HMF7854_03410 [Sphingomonas ginkgonis]